MKIKLSKWFQEECEFLCWYQQGMEEMAIG